MPRTELGAVTSYGDQRNTLRLGLHHMNSQVRYCDVTQMITGVPMETMTTVEMSYRPGQLRRAVQNGNHVGITFREHTYGRVVPNDWYERATAALEREVTRKEASVT